MVPYGQDGHAEREERLQQVGPIIDNIWGESLKLKLKYVYRVMERRGMFPPIPDSMKGVALDVESVSILVLAQKAASTGGLERLVAFVGNLGAVNPDVYYKIDMNEMVDEMNALLGNPQKVVRSTQDATKMLDDAKQMAQQAHQSQVAEQASNAAKNSAQTAQVLSQTQIGGGKNALSELLSGGAAAG